MRAQRALRRKFSGARYARGISGAYVNGVGISGWGCERIGRNLCYTTDLYSSLADARDARAQGRTLTDQLHGMAPHADASVWCTQACIGTRYATRAAGGDRTVFEWREGVSCAPGLAPYNIQL